MSVLQKVGCSERPEKVCRVSMRYDSLPQRKVVKNIRVFAQVVHSTCPAQQSNLLTLRRSIDAAVPVPKTAKQASNRRRKGAKPCRSARRARQSHGQSALVTMNSHWSSAAPDSIRPQGFTLAWVGCPHCGIRALSVGLPAGLVTSSRRKIAGQKFHAGPYGMRHCVKEITWLCIDSATTSCANLHPPIPPTCGALP
jgi:hypothetical protein